MSENKPGRYIVIEGSDGAGTTTQKDLLTAQLASLGRQVLGIREPGQTEFGKRIREIFKDASLERSVETNIDLATIDRRETTQQVIAPAVSNGIDVISDRNWFSTVAYQGFGEGYRPLEGIIDKSHAAMGRFLLPHLAVIIDVPIEVSQQRMRNRGSGANDFFEQKGSDFFERVRKGYLYVAELYDIEVIDGTQSIDKVHEEIAMLLEH